MAATDNRFQQFSKTKMCKFDAVGRCKKGRGCPFAHNVVELKPVPDLRCTKLCKTFVLSGVCNDASCGYAHTKEELRSTGTFHKTKLCRFMQTGHCSLGKKCNFAHNISELREMDNIAATAPEDVEQLPQGLILPPGLKSDVTDLMTPEGIMLPPGLGWESYAENNSKDTIDSQHLDAGEAHSLAHDSPAYVPLPTTLDTKSLSTAIGQPWDGTDLFHYSQFDFFNGDILSTNPGSRPPSPPSSPSPGGSGCGSGQDLDFAAASSLYYEGPWETLTQAAGRLGDFGYPDAEQYTDQYLATKPFEDTSYAMPQSFVC